MVTTPILHRFYNAMQKRHPDVLFHGDRSRREIALTFDDGPHPLHTRPVLDMLKKHKISATFFLLGEHVGHHPRIVQQIYQDGHQIGIHGYRHIPFPLENAAALKGHLIQSRNTIADICSIFPGAIRYIRPPFGTFTARTLSQLKEWDYHPVMWSSIPQHWMQPIDWSIKQMLDETVPGVIIDLHDGHGHGKNVAPLLDIVIPRLKATRFEFVTIEQMRSSFGGKPS